MNGKFSLPVVKAIDLIWTSFIPISSGWLFG